MQQSVKSKCLLLKGKLTMARMFNRNLFICQKKGKNKEKEQEKNECEDV